MSHSFTAKGNRNYRYYVCHRAQKRGWQACPSPSIPAGEIERFVVNEIKAIGRDPLVIRETLVQARRQAEEQIDLLQTERSDLWDRLRSDHADLGRLPTARPAALSAGRQRTLSARRYERKSLRHLRKNENAESVNSRRFVLTRGSAEIPPTEKAPRAQPSSE